MEGGPVVATGGKLLGMVIPPLVRRRRRARVTGGDSGKDPGAGVGVGWGEAGDESELELVEAVPLVLTVESIRDALADVRRVWGGGGSGNGGARDERRPATLTAGGAALRNVVPHAVPPLGSPAVSLDNPLDVVVRRSVVLVETDGGASWASGVVVRGAVTDAATGGLAALVVTNAHVVHPSAVSAGGDGKGPRVRAVRVRVPECSEGSGGGRREGDDGGTETGGAATRLGQSSPALSWARPGETGWRDWRPARAVYVSDGPLDVAVLAFPVIPEDEGRLQAATLGHDQEVPGTLRADQDRIGGDATVTVSNGVEGHDRIPGGRRGQGRDLVRGGYRRHNPNPSGDPIAPGTPVAVVGHARVGPRAERFCHAAENIAAPPATLGGSPHPRRTHPGRRHGSAQPPSVTLGVVSAVVCRAGPPHEPVMVQTTAAVWEGASGGAVVSRQDGRVLGLITSNARHGKGGWRLGGSTFVGHPGTDV